ncbi:MAG: NYN domain-containing protein [Actinomycetota bacterium]
MPNPGPPRPRPTRVVVFIDTQVRYYTGIHDPNRRSQLHGEMDRRLAAYRQAGVYTDAIPLRYDGSGRAREKGVDVRLAIDLTRLGTKGLYDAAIVVSEDSDLDEAVQDVYELRDHERWIAVENAQPWSPHSHTRWLKSARRLRRITVNIFATIRDDQTY